jgi:hypothetical protein
MIMVKKIQYYVTQGDYTIVAGRWFSPGTPVSSTNQINRHKINEILLKVALNTTTLTLQLEIFYHPIICNFKNLSQKLTYQG